MIGTAILDEVAREGLWEELSEPLISEILSDSLFLQLYAYSSVGFSSLLLCCFSIWSFDICSFSYNESDHVCILSSRLKCFIKIYW